MVPARLIVAPRESAELELAGAKSTRDLEKTRV